MFLLAVINEHVYFHGSLLAKLEQIIQLKTQSTGLSNQKLLMVKKKLKKISHSCEKNKIKTDHHEIKGESIEVILKYSKAKKLIW